MGNNASLHLSKEEITQIQKETDFTSNQIERLYSRFTNLDRNDCGSLSKEDFLRIPELAINPLGNRIVDGFFNGGKTQINFKEFAMVVSRFRPVKETSKKNSRIEKLRFVFDMYDLDGDDYITRDELVTVLQMMVGENIGEELLTSVAERIIVEADTSGDRKISFDEFSRTMDNIDVEHKLSIRFLN